MHSDLIVNLIWITPFIGSLIAALVGVMNKRYSSYIGVASLLVSAILSVPVATSYLANPEEPIVANLGTWFEIPVQDGTIPITVSSYLDGLSTILMLLVIWLSFLIGVYSLKYMENDYGEHRYWVFFTFFVGSMLLIVMTDNLFMLLLGWEGTSLASYALISHWYRDDDHHTYVGDIGRRSLGKPIWFTPSQSGVRAILMTGVADIGFILAVGAIIVIGGTATIQELDKAFIKIFDSLDTPVFSYVFLLLLTLGALAKSAQFPLHEWLVTAMTGPASVSALIHAATMVKAGVYFVLRFVPLIYMASLSLPASLTVYIDLYFTTLMILGAITAFMLASMAVVARELKLILAYSTASQIGYMFMAAGAIGFLEDPALGLTAGLSHLISHAVFKASLFLAAGAFIHSIGSRFIDEMSGYGRYLKITSFSFVVASLALAAVPPFSGFWSKDLVLEGIYEINRPIILFLGLAAALLTAFYSIRASLYIVNYKKPTSLEQKHVHEASPIMYFPYLFLAIISIPMGVLWFIGINDFAYILSSSMKAFWEVPKISYKPDLAFASTLIAILGVSVALIVYGWKKIDIYNKLSANKALSNIHKFLYDRWFINSVLYYIFVDSFSYITKAVGRYVEYGVVDRLYHRVIPSLGSILSVALRYIQVGLINVYLISMIFGFMILLLIAVWW